MTAGLLDTSVVVDWHDPVVVRALPDEMAISAITAAELTAGPHLANTSGEAARRRARLQEVEAKLEPLPLDSTAVRSYGLVVAALAREVRQPRSRLADLPSQPRDTPTVSISTPATAMTSEELRTSATSSTSEDIAARSLQMDPAAKRWSRSRPCRQAVPKGLSMM